MTGSELRWAPTLLALAMLTVACGTAARASPPSSAAAEEPVMDVPAPRAYSTPPFASVTPLPTVRVVPTAAPATLTTLPTPAILAPPTAPSSPTPTPQPQFRQLDVPLHRQEHALSCEAAALQMALGTLGHQVTENDLLARLARDPTPRRVMPNGSVVWGDPEAGFVGSWDGVFARDGYGVYEGPIAELARNEGLAGSIGLRDAAPAIVYDAVRAGHPVVVWMPYGGHVKGRGVWTTSAGVLVDYVVTEHAVVLAGIGPDGVVYADPYTAQLEPAGFADFEAAMSELHNRVVIVKP